MKFNFQKNEEKKKTAIATYHRETGMCKADCVADYLISTYFYRDAPSIKILLFAHHKDVMDIFELRFKTQVN